MVLPMLIWGQTLSHVKLHPQHALSKWKVPAANYSAIANLTSNQTKVENYMPYALISDKDTSCLFLTIGIKQDLKSGDIISVSYNENDKFGKRDKAMDTEGIAYCADKKTLMISCEHTQEITEYNLLGQPTSHKLSVPEEAKKCYPNYGFEALTYDSNNQIFWAITEHSLPMDQARSIYLTRTPCLLRLLAFDKKGNFVSQYAYRTDTPKADKENRNYAFGVSALTALDDGSLLVLEREFNVTKNYIGSWVEHKIYRITPKGHENNISFSTDLKQLKEENFLEKTLVVQFTTKLSLSSRDLANYEGMCMGERLPDGRYTILLISDSQDGYGNNLYRMKDYIRVITFAIEE